MNREMPWESEFPPQTKRPQRAPQAQDFYEEDMVAPRRAPQTKRKSFSLMQFVFSRPLDSLAIAAAGLFVSGILINALALQPKSVEKATQPLPSRIAEVTPPPQSMPVVQPQLQAIPTRVVEKMMTLEEVQAELKKRGLYKDSVDGQMGSKTAAAIKEYQKQTGLRQTGELNDEVSLSLRQSQTAPRSPSTANKPQQKANIADLIGEEVDPKTKKPLTTASIPTGSRSVLKVQEALASIGYGPIKTDGTYSNETKVAIERFEKDRKIPVTGQVTPRLVKELSAVTGLAIE